MLIEINEYVTLPEFSRLRGFPLSSVHLWVRRGRLPYFEVGGGVRLINKSAEVLPRRVAGWPESARAKVIENRKKRKAGLRP